MITSEQTRSSSQTRAFRPATGAQLPHDGVATPTLSDSGKLAEASPNAPAAPEKTEIPKLNYVEPTPPSGSPSTTPGGRFLRDPLTRGASRSPSQSPFRLSMPSISPGQLAFSAMQYLPVPTLILNNLKTVVLANEAMGRMLGLSADSDDDESLFAAVERLRGQTLSQVGIDMLQDGRPVWLTWEAFIDSLVNDNGVHAPVFDGQRPTSSGGDATPTATAVPGFDQRRKSSSRSAQDAVVEVVISRRDFSKTTLDNKYKSKESASQIFAKMIVTIWELEDKQMYFTLTFTNTESSPTTLGNTRRSIARPSILEAAERKSITTSNSSSVASSRDSNSPSFHSPGVVTMSSSPFPPMGPPSLASHISTPSLLQKMILMKDALLDNTQMPILAMWKDGSVMFPNKAARKLFSKDADLDSAVDGNEILGNWQVWTDDFSRQLDVEEYPISILVRTETPFGSIRIGMYDENGKQIVFDVLGEAIRDDHTGEFLAAVVTCRDVTVMTQEITHIKERDEERFRVICDTMPQLVWTATPEGYNDFFNTRWYTYTGLTPEECIGRTWQSPLHPDDVPEARMRWERSLETGEPYVMEYRCRSKEGEYRWFLVRALAVRDMDTGEIDKWLGTCTDVHEGIETKLDAQRTRQQLLSVIAHSHVTIFTVDTNRCVTMLEGALLWKNSHGHSRSDSNWYIGENIYTVFNRLTEQSPEGEKPEWLRAMEGILEGRVDEDVVEHGLDDRWYRTRFLPMHDTRTQEIQSYNQTDIEGVIGVVMDVTELKVRGEALQVQSKEKRRAMANEAAAKEANRLKSQFLANMSHEIRTPITGVLGMAELLAGMELDEEQQDYVENIQSSATSLLTVINDILDFSKVESGRLDIEEVQFSLSLIVKEVGKMLQFAVERKNLDFWSDIGGDIENDMVVIGDPGRVRQIITNLLTNSIKFTHQGHVRFSVVKEKETTDTIEIKFVIADTGIGIQEDVRKKLFQPFSQGDASTARRFGGTGLGLTICKNLVELMHGRITLESGVGNGTTATFWIPFSKPQGPPKSNLAHAGAIPDRLQSELSLSCNSSEYEQINSPASDGGSAASGFPRRRPSLRTPPNVEQELPRSERSNIHVLVVEDNPVNQKIAIKTIGRLGFHVTAAWNGREALDYLMSTAHGNNRKPDIILMDVQMPVIDGYKCTHLLRHHLPYKTLVQDVPIVAMTASAIQGDREKCTKAGMDDYLAKPVTMPILEKMLVRWSLARRRGPISRDLSASDCSEMSEHCENADIPHVGLEDDMGDAMSSSIDDLHNSPITPRPLTANGQNEPSPFDSPAVELRPQIRRREGEREESNRLQETKLIDAAGGPSNYRADSYQKARMTPDSLTEENVNKLKSESQPPV